MPLLVCMMETNYKGYRPFGPYIKWDGMFINVPKRYNFEELTKPEMDELIEAKIKKKLTGIYKTGRRKKYPLKMPAGGQLLSLIRN